MPGPTAGHSFGSIFPFPEETHMSVPKLIAALAAAALICASGASARLLDAPPRQDLRSPDARDAARAPSEPADLAHLLARARLATARYATDVRRARRAGYTTIVTQHIPDMGRHLMNPDVTGFDVTRPPILVYVKRAGDWQLVAFEWVFAERPATDPLPGAQYGSFPAACHYVDGTFHEAASEAECRRRSPESGARFGFWHPDLVTLHVWAWYPNPDGIYAGTNPLIRPFNR
jgi:hypothetical protein